MLMAVAEANGGYANPQAQIIHRETRWFERSGSDAVALTRPRISVSRWVGQANEPCEQECEIEADRHVIGIALRPMEDVTVYAARKLIHAGLDRRAFPDFRRDLTEFDQRDADVFRTSSCRRHSATMAIPALLPA